MGTNKHSYLELPIALFLNPKPIPKPFHLSHEIDQTKKNGQET